MTSMQRPSAGNHLTALERVLEQEAGLRGSTVGELVRERSRTHGDRVAIDVFDRGERATYAEVEAESNRLASALRGFGVRKGDRVAVMLPNRLAFPLSWFALAKIGAIMVPVNMRYTPREIEYVVSDAGCSFAIVDAAAGAAFQAMAPWPVSLPEEHVLVMGGDTFGKARAFESFVVRYSTAPVSGSEPGPDDLLSIQYTSGTTGFPKGCMQTHDYWMVFSHQAVCWDSCQPARLLSAQPFFYADPQWHLLKSYRLGATLFMAPQMSSSRFLGWLRQHAIEWCQFPELIARQIESVERGATKLKSIAAFGWSPDTCRRFQARFAVPASDAFAMTEIGFGTLMPQDLWDMRDSGSVGLRAPFRTVRIVREDVSEAAAGEIGELWVKGRSIFKGYWNKPKANYDAFVGEWFRTGDLFRVDERGFFWLVGRVKDMIRRSSENIAAREVEAVIREIPEIEDVAAVPVRDPVRGEEVKIYIQLKDGLSREQVPVDQILEHARARLAVFKVPRYVSYVANFPRTVSNKIIKRDLVTDSLDLRLGSYDAQDKVWR